MKNNIDFYQHYANADQHPKFKMLRVEFGWAGEGKFWALNNRIAQAEDCCLNVSKKYNKAAIANDLDFNLKEFDDFVEFLKIDCELIQECKPGIITTDIIQENFERVSEKRIKNQNYYKKTLSDTFSDSKSTENEIQQAENTQRKGKESKVKKKTPNKDNFFEKYLSQKIQENKLEPLNGKIFEFYKYRMAKTKKKQYQTEKGIDGLFRNLFECRNQGFNLKDCLDITMERNWQTPDPEYLKGKAIKTDKQLTGDEIRKKHGF